MRVRGDAEACRGTAEQLRRAGAAVRQDADRWRAVRRGVPSWTGRAADGWAATVLDRSDAGRELADRIGALAGALARHADGLQELQSRARALREQARDAGLHLDDDGWIAPLPLPGFIPPSALQEAFRSWPGTDSWHVREDLLRRVAVLRAAVEQQHDELTRELGRLEAPATMRPGAAPLPGWWDLPPAAADGGARALAHSAAAGSGAAAAGRAVSRVVPGLGLVYGVAVDVGAQDRSLAEAVVRNGAAAGASAAAVAAAGALVPAAVAAAPILLPVALAMGVGLVAAAVVDAAVRRDPPAEHLDRRRPRPAPGPAPTAPGTRPAPPCPPTPSTSSTSLTPS